MEEGTKEAAKPASEDAGLVAAMAAGEENALADLYDRFGGLVLGLARRILANEAEAEEILQEVFLQAWKQAERYERRRSSVSTWLVLITRSRSIDRVRSRQVKSRTLASLKKEKPNSYTSPEGVGAVLHAQRRQRLQTAMADLPVEQREVLELAFYRGLTQSEIASASEIPLGTVKTRTLLAMRKLRKALQGEIEDLL